MKCGTNWPSGTRHHVQCVEFAGQVGLKVSTSTRPCSLSELLFGPQTWNVCQRKTLKRTFFFLSVCVEKWQWRVERGSLSSRKTLGLCRHANRRRSPVVDNSLVLVSGTSLSLLFERTQLVSLDKLKMRFFFCRPIISILDILCVYLVSVFICLCQRFHLIRYYSGLLDSILRLQCRIVR